MWRIINKLFSNLSSNLTWSLHECIFAHEAKIDCDFYEKFCFFSWAPCGADLGSDLWIECVWLTGSGLALHHSDEFYTLHHCDGIKLPSSPLHLISSLKKKWSEIKPSSSAYLRVSVIWEKHMWNCPSFAGWRSSMLWCELLLSSLSNQTLWFFGEGPGCLMGILWRGPVFSWNHGAFPRGSIRGEEGSAGGEPEPPSATSHPACGGSDLLSSVLPELFCGEPEQCGRRWLGQETRSSNLGEMGSQQSNPLLSAHGERVKCPWYDPTLNLLL